MSSSRQLAAIMFTDIVGYTALMGSDEQKAFSILNKNRALQKPIIETFNGRWIKELGDGVMASFNTVAEAVYASIKIQEGCNALKEFQLRIGVHLGDVLFENDDVFGDGVNIASRIQSVAKAGSIYISESVHHNVSNKKDIQSRFVKEETLKNVKEPVRIYEILFTNEIISLTDTKLNAPSRNSIAVLPFANMSSDPEQEYFSDGLTEEIISDLSGINELLVISRSSIMTFKGTQKKLKEIAAELNVRYILEGSVRKAGNNIRITAQLIDAETDSHTWSEKYNGTLEDIFEIQEKVSRSIVEALKLKLTQQQDEQIAQRPIPNVHAYECYLKARQEIFKGSKESLNNAFKLLQNALDLIGPNALLYAMMGYANFFYFRFVNKTEKSFFNTAKEYTSKAFTINSVSTMAHVVQGWIEWAEGNLQALCNSMKSALQIEPNNSDAIFGLLEIYLYAGKATQTLPVADKLLEIDPLTPLTHIMKGSFYTDSGIEEGLSYFERAYYMDSDSPVTKWMLASAYFWCGKNETGYPLVDSLEKNLPDWAYTRQLLFLKKGLQGDRQQALAYATDDLATEAKSDYHFAFHLAECYAVINEKEKALDMLEYTTTIFFPYRFFQKNILFENIRKEKRFEVLIEVCKKKSETFVI